MAEATTCLEVDTGRIRFSLSPYRRSPLDFARPSLTLLDLNEFSLAGVW